MSYDPTKRLPHNRRFFARVAAKAGTKTGSLYIYDVIGDGWFGGVSPKAVADALEEMGKVDVLDIFINSPGGNVFDANAIYENIKRHTAKKIVHVDGLAASAASVLAMVGDEVITSAGAMWMIHDPWSVAIGSKADMLQAAEMLDKVRGTLVDRYAARTKQGKKQISDWMEVETWMSAAEAKERGFTDSVTDDEEVEETEEANGALAFLDNYKNTPAALRKKSRDPRTLLAHMDMKVAALKLKAEQGDEEEEEDEEEAQDATKCECKAGGQKPCGCCDSCHGAKDECKCESSKDRPCGCCDGCGTHGKKTENKNGRASPVAQHPGQPGGKK